MNASLRLPYPGLRAFTRDESDLFFGRDNCVNAMVDRLAATRFLAVLGPSGSGKSSLVRTGLLDALDLGLHPKAASGWKVAELHPGGQPLRQLATALLHAAHSGAATDEDIEVLTGFLRQGPRSLSEWMSYGNLPPGTNLLVLVDQFEELFRYGDYAQREETEAFVGLLLESADSAAGDIHLVITMRSEYLGACASILGLAERISTGLYLTPRMSREECQEAIEGPARVLGFTVEPALVNRLLNDLASFAPWEGPEDLDLATLFSHQADQLPLMQHVLNRLWVRAANAESGGAAASPPIVLKLADYDQFGGLSGALDEHGAEVLAGLGSSRLLAAENVFRALVTGTSLATAVRRPCRMGELAGLVESAGDSRSDAVAIVEAFRAPGCNFLRTTRDSLADDLVIVDISHESLIRQWTPLRDWLEKEVRDGLAWRRLIQAEDHYRNHEGGLLTGLDLSNLTAWWESAKPTPRWAERHGGKFDSTQAFLDASRLADIERSDEERRTRMQKRNLLLGLAASVALLLAIGGFLTWKDMQAAKLETALSSARSSAALAKAQGDRLDAEKKVAEAERQKAEDSEHQFERYTKAVVDLIDSEKYKGLPGLNKFKNDLAATINQYQGGGVKNELRLGSSMEGIGDAVEAKKEYAQIYNQGKAQIDAVPAGSPPDESLESSFLEAGYRYSWLLFDIGENEEGRRVLEGMEKVVNEHHSASPGAILLLPYSHLENLESRFQSDQGTLATDAHLKDQYQQESKAHLEKAVYFAAQADNLKPTIEAKAIKFQSLRNLSAYQDRDLKRSMREQACAVAQEMIDKSPADSRSIRARVQCLRDDASAQIAEATKRAADLQKQKSSATPDSTAAQESAAAIEADYVRAEKSYRHATEMLGYLINLEQESPALWLDMVDVETDISNLWYKRGNQSETTRYNRTAAEHLEKALKGRTLFQGSPTRVKDLYTSVSSTTFADTKEELEFYQKIYDAVDKSFHAFPKSPSFSYVAEDANANIGRLLSKEPERRSEAINHLTAAIDSLNRKGMMKDLSRYSEDYARNCGAYAQRSEVYAAMKRIEPMLADLKTMSDLCSPALNKYPWDFYLHWYIWEAEAAAGKALFESKRYSEALPHLEYASHWGVGESSKLLANMYLEGLGVERNPGKTDELEVLGSGQIFRKYSVPVDYGGDTGSFSVYIRDWPKDYAFEGIDDQVQWMKIARGGTISPDVVESFRKLHKIARDNNVSYPELVEYALEENKDKDKPKPDPAKELEEARKKYADEPSVENLRALRTSANTVFSELVKANQQAEAAALEQELLDDAEQLARKHPTPRAYRVAWYVWKDKGDRLKANDREGAMRAFQRSLELANLLPDDDNGEDDYKHLYSYERIGDLDSMGKKFDDACTAYSKAVDAGWKYFTPKITADNLSTLGEVTVKLSDTLLKLNDKAEADKQIERLPGAAENLLAHSKATADLSEASYEYAAVARQLYASGEAAEAHRYLVRSQELAAQIADDAPDGVWLKYRRFSNAATLLLANGAPDDIKNANRQASLALEHYITFRTAKPPRMADADHEDLYQLDGDLSWIALLGGDSDKAKKAAEEGLKLNPKAYYIEANLAHCLLLSGQPNEATAKYMDARKGTVNDEPIPKATREDFDTLKRLGIARPELYATMDSILKKMEQD